MRDFCGRRQTRPFILAFLAFGVVAAVLPTVCVGNGVGNEASESHSESPWNLFSRAEESRLGSELHGWLRKRAEIVSQGPLAAYVERLGARLEAHLSDAGLEAHFPVSPVILADTEPHAFAIPGGSIYLTTGMLAALRNEQQLAALLAHEIAHTQLRHATQAMSRHKRFLVPAALAAASTGKVSLHEALEQVGLAPVPGAPWRQHRESDETEAIGLATELLTHSPYDPAAAAALLPDLHAGRTEVSSRFLEEHPLPDGSLPERSRKVPLEPSGTLASGRDFQQLQSVAGGIVPESSALAAIYSREPSELPDQPAKSRELFITRSYLFSYPSDWTIERPGKEAIVVAPKGEREANGIRTGVIAGTLQWDPHRQDARKLLLDRIEELRPGLRVDTQPNTLPPTGNRMDSLFLSGSSGPQGAPEVAWVLTRGLSQRVFYLMMIAPRSEFPAYRAEFERIFQSIDFKGHPADGRPDPEALAFRP